MTGCAKNPSSSVTLPPSFVSEVEITADETAYGATLSRFADGYWQVELSSPAAVKGLIFTVNAGDTEVGYEGLKFTFDTSRFPVGSVVAAAIDNLDRIFASPLAVINGEEECLATGSSGEESYTFTLTKNYVPKKLELAKCGLCINFTNFSEIEKVEE